MNGSHIFLAHLSSPPVGCMCGRWSSEICFLKTRLLLLHHSLRKRKEEKKEETCLHRGDQTGPSGRVAWRETRLRMVVEKKEGKEGFDARVRPRASWGDGRWVGRSRTQGAFTLPKAVRGKRRWLPADGKPLLPGVATFAALLSWPIRNDFTRHADLQRPISRWFSSYVFELIKPVHDDLCVKRQYQTINIHPYAGNRMVCETREVKLLCLEPGLFIFATDYEPTIECPVRQTANTTGLMNPEWIMQANPDNIIMGLRLH